MPVPDQVRDDGSGIRKVLNYLDAGLRRNDVLWGLNIFRKSIKFQLRKTRQLITFSRAVFVQSDIIFKVR
jgi:hypothetical protein